MPDNKEPKPRDIMFDSPFKLTVIPDPSIPLDTAVLFDDARLYQKVCQVCHGKGRIPRRIDPRYALLCIEAGATPNPGYTSCPSCNNQAGAIHQVFSAKVYKFKLREES